MAGIRRNGVKRRKNRLAARRARSVWRSTPVCWHWRNGSEISNLRHQKHRELCAGVGEKYGNLTSRTLYSGKYRMLRAIAALLRLRLRHGIAHTGK